MAVAEFASGLFNIFCTIEQIGHMFENYLSGRRDGGQLFSGTLEYLDPKFILEKFNLMADTGLRRIEFFRGGGYVKFIADDGVKKAQLL
jgi:hypothetical protein